MILAAIDIGTNSTKVSIARADGAEIEVVHEESEITRLGMRSRSEGRSVSSTYEVTL